eukprot:NODE_18173_length_906_cov_8.207959.p1 GENE.NODE_18173_length_906_cov_8.207959~~NODE_18173_length_906_cov_8.207959.p1  ORF type:complete len:255 (-),score=46.99 NODE_18173_length_906_cov_8.207959:35-799(-)
MAPSVRARPCVNVSDVPELMWGAEPSATVSQRECCVRLQCEEAKEEHVTLASPSTMARNLEAAFPLLDPALIRALFAESPTPQDAINALLVLSAATAVPIELSAATAVQTVDNRWTMVDTATVMPMPSDGSNVASAGVCVEDESEFPPLSDKGGWQVIGALLLNRSANAEFGSAWRDCVAGAKDLVAPTPAHRVSVAARGRRSNGRQDDGDGPEPLTDYELRQQAGWDRVKHRAQHGRRCGHVKQQTRELEAPR